ncbi:MAG: hypothetical protein ACLQF1_02265 [Methyloceanibacter sp.]
MAANTKKDYVDLALSYFGGWRRFRSFTSNDTLTRELRLSDKELREFKMAMITLGLATRVNQTSERFGGLRWVESEVRPLIPPRNDAVLEQLQASTSSLWAAR